MLAVLVVVAVVRATAVVVVVARVVVVDVAWLAVAPGAIGATTASFAVEQAPAAAPRMPTTRRKRARSTRHGTGRAVVAGGRVAVRQRRCCC